MKSSLPILTTRPSYPISELSLTLPVPISKLSLARQYTLSRDNAQLNGWHYAANNRILFTGFLLVKIRGRKCIQFTDDRNGTKYALKVINGTDVAFEVSFSSNRK